MRKRPRPGTYVSITGRLLETAWLWESSQSRERNPPVTCASALCHHLPQLLEEVLDEELSDYASLLSNAISFPRPERTSCPQRRR